MKTNKDKCHLIVSTNEIQIGDFQLKIVAVKGC